MDMMIQQRIESDHNPLLLTLEIRGLDPQTEWTGIVTADVIVTNDMRRVKWAPLLDYDNILDHIKIAVENTLTAISTLDTQDNIDTAFPKAYEELFAKLKAYFIKNKKSSNGKGHKSAKWYDKDCRVAYKHLSQAIKTKQ